MTIIITGGMGFIGANIAHALHQRGFDLVVVDNLENGDKFVNLAGVPLKDYCDKADFLTLLQNDHWGEIEAIFHQGACSSTVERNGQYMMKNNTQYSLQILDICQEKKIPLIYASSAAVYGLAEVCHENDDLKPEHQPLNVYGYSKWLFDQQLRRRWASHPTTTPVVGLRYFNVYGAREQHKGRMASVVYHLFRQLQRGDTMTLFDGWAGYRAGEQKRDFIHIDDVVSVNLFFLDEILANRNKSGIYNCGSGVARPFNDIPRAIEQMQHHLESPSNIDALLSKNLLKYAPFPEDLKGRYQSYTQADLTNLREAGYTGDFLDIFSGVARYWPWLNQSLN